MRDTPVVVLSTYKTYTIGFERLASLSGCHGCGVCDSAHGDTECHCAHAQTRLGTQSGQGEATWINSELACMHAALCWVIFFYYCIDAWNANPGACLSKAKI